MISALAEVQKAIASLEERLTLMRAAETALKAAFMPGRKADTPLDKSAYSNLMPPEDWSEAAPPGGERPDVSKSPFDNPDDERDAIMRRRYWAGRESTSQMGPHLTDLARLGREYNVPITKARRICHEGATRRPAGKFGLGPPLDMMHEK